MLKVPSPDDDLPHMSGPSTRNTALPDAGEATEATAPPTHFRTVVVPIARPVVVRGVERIDPLVAPPSGPGRGKRLAVASVVVGVVPLVPLLSPLTGMVMGIMALRRMGRARRQGLDTPGSGWAWAGIGLNVVSLLGWVLLLVLGTVVGSFVSTTVGILDGLQLPSP